MRTGSARMEMLRRAAYRFGRSGLSVTGLVIVALLFLLAAFGPLLAPYPEHITGGVSTAARFGPPSAQHWFGTNELGQDVLSLVLGGARVSVLAGLAVVLLGALAGTVVGAVAGYAGGWTDEILMRLTDLKLTIPGLILAMAVAAALGPGIVNMVFAIALSWWPGYARLVRGEFISVRNREFVQSCVAMGMGHLRIIGVHILPNTLSSIIVTASLMVATAILIESGLSFLGLSDANTMSWGFIIGSGRSVLRTAWWICAIPGLAILLTVMSINLVGDGLNDALNPRLKTL